MALLPARDRTPLYPPFRTGEPCPTLPNGLRQYQQDCVDYLLPEASPLDIAAVMVGTGMGKTCIAAAFLARLPPRVAVVLFTKTGLVEPTVKELKLWLERLGGGLSEHVFVAASKEEWARTLETARADDRRFCVVTYSNSRANADCASRFDVFLFDEAHVEMPFVERLFPTGVLAVKRAWPRAVIMTGTRLLRDNWTEKHVSDAFLLQKTAAVAKSLRMGELTFDTVPRELMSASDTQAYFLRLLANIVTIWYIHDDYKKKRLFALAAAWWSYHVNGYTWAPEVNARWHWAAADCLRQVLTESCKVKGKHPPGRTVTQWKVCADGLLRSGVFTCLDALQRAAGDQGASYAERLRELTGDVLPAVPDEVLYAGMSPRPTPLDVSVPLGATRLFKNHMPSLYKWREWHRMSMKSLWGVTEHVLPGICDSLRWKEGQPAPQVLLTLPSDGERAELLRRLLNYPQKTVLCPSLVDAWSDPCDRDHCPYSHQSWMFNTKGRRLPARSIQNALSSGNIYDRYKFVWEDGAFNGEILESPGLDCARIYLVLPDMLAAERSRVVRLFCDECWGSVNGLRVVIAQNRMRPNSNRFLRFFRIGVDYMAQRLEDYLLTPALLIGVGKTLNVGFNLHQRVTGLCLTEFEGDFDGVKQRCGRIQRIPRPFSPLATSKITVTMPFVRGSVEEMVFLPCYREWKESRDDDDA